MPGKKTDHRLGAVPDEPPDAGADAPLERLARARLFPDEGGHWPVALLATRDPRAVGIGSHRHLSRAFSWAVVTARFGDPIRVEGIVRIERPRAELERLARGWERLARRAGEEPFLSMVGLGGVFDELEVAAEDNRVRFSLPLSSAEVRAALVFFQLQGESIERQIERRGRRGR